MRFLYSLLLYLTLLCSCSFEQLTEKNPTVSIVSIGLDYANVAEIPTLHGTVSDACEVAVCLENIYELKQINCNVYLMVEDGASSKETDYLYPSADNIISTVNSINAGSEDLIIIYFSGHGDIENNQALLITGCTKQDPIYSSIEMDYLFNVLKQKSCKCAVIIDSCYAGQMAQNGAADMDFMQAMENIFSERDFSFVSVIASSMPEQTSLVSAVFTEEGLTECHSLYTIKLLEALGWAHSCIQSSEITIGNRNYEVYGYLKDCPESMTCSELFGKSIQTWSVSNQVPVINKTSLPIQIIPQAGN